MDTMPEQTHRLRRKRSRGDQHVKRIKKLLREMGPLSIGEIEEHLSMRYKWAPTTNQLGNYLSKRPDFRLIEVVRKRSIIGGNYDTNVYGLTDHEA
jgi:hypothetical protein